MRRAVAAAALLLLVAVADAGAAARQWAWLGVRIRDVTEQEMDDLARRHGIREGFGVLIVDVIDGTPAARAGLKNGDVVVAFEGRPVTDTRLLQRLIASAAPDADIRLVVLRTEGRRAVPVHLVTMPRDVAGDRVAALYGFSLREPIGPDTAQAAAVPVVGLIERDGPAERAGLLAGDLVLQVNDHPVVSRQAAREALAEAGPDRALTMIVRRGDDRATVTLEPSPTP